jgi:hypothetical protein
VRITLWSFQPAVLALAIDSVSGRRMHDAPSAMQLNPSGPPDHWLPQRLMESCQMQVEDPVTGGGFRNLGE